MIKKDITVESWRCYKWIDPRSGKERSYRINNPVSLYLEKNSSCHIVTSRDETNKIIAHCVPSVGNFGCVLTFGKDDGSDPVIFVRAAENE